MKMCKMNYLFILEIIFGSIFNIHRSTPILCCITCVGGGGAGGASAPPKVFIWRKSGQNLWKPSLNLCKPEETPENMSKDGAQKNMKSSCFGGRSFFSGTFGRIRAKILRIPQN